MTTNSEMVARYYHLREIGQQIGESLVDCLGDDVVNEGARKLGLHKGGVPTYETEDELAVLLDYCIFDIRRNGKNAVERYLAKAPPPRQSEEMLVLQAMVRARYSIFEVEEVVTGVGVQLRDLVRGDRQFTMEVGYSTTAQKGDVLATRIFTPDTFAMTTGAAMPKERIEDREEFDKKLAETFKAMGIDRNKHLSPEQESRMATIFIRTCLSQGVLSHIVYEAPPGSHDDINLPPKSSWDISLHTVIQPQAAAAPVATAPDRNDPCPCGSGKKFKNCCGGKN